MFTFLNERPPTGMFLICALGASVKSFTTTPFTVLSFALI
jgi:hypothetical protein